MNPNRHPGFLRDPTEPRGVPGSEEVRVGKKGSRKGEEKNKHHPKLNQSKLTETCGITVIHGSIKRNGMNPQRIKLSFVVPYKLKIRTPVIYGYGKSCRT